MLSLPVLLYTQISIHAPRTGSDPQGRRPRWSAHHISIHAPRTGSDTAPHQQTRRHPAFQSTLPARGATIPHCCLLPRNGFQSTLPARGATFGILRCVADLKSFQSTLPARGATAGAGIFQPARIFQSTLPARGATLIRWVCCRGFFHFNPRSPHGERLRRVRLPCAGRAYFNPRFPHGERRCWKGTPENRNYFNPRSPHGERRKLDYVA